MATPHDRRYDAFLARLRRAREATGLNQTEVAEKLDLPQQAVSRIEVGERRLDVSEFCALCRLYEKRPQDLMPEFPG